MKEEEGAASGGGISTRTMEIVVAGDKIEHKVNGATARSSKVKGGASPFKIRAEIGVMQVKNIRVKEGS